MMTDPTTLGLLTRHRREKATALLQDVADLETKMEKAPKHTAVLTAADDVWLLISAIRQSAMSGQSIGRDVLTRAENARVEYSIGYREQGPGTQIEDVITKAIRADLVDTSPSNSTLGVVKAIR